jgi:hypothetical protein
MATVPDIQDYLTFDLNDQNRLPFIDLKTSGIQSDTERINKYNFLTIQDIVNIIDMDATTGTPILNAVNNCVILNPSTIDADHIKTMCTIYRYVMIKLYCYFQSRALGIFGAPSGAPITLPSKIIFNGVNISTLEFFKFINDGFILRMDLDRMGKPGEVISRRNTNPPGLYSTLLNNVKKPEYKPKTRHILGNVIKNFQIGNVVSDSGSYVFACTQRDHIDAHEDYIYNLVNLISNVTYVDINTRKKVYSFGMGYILSPGSTGCAVNVCAFIGIFILAMILYILREHSSYFTGSNGTNESMLLNTYSLLNACNIVDPMLNFQNTNNMFLYKFTLDTSGLTRQAVGWGGDGIGTAGTVGTYSFQPYSPAVIDMQLPEAELDPVINEIKKLASQTVEAQILLWGSNYISLSDFIRTVQRIGNSAFIYSKLPPAVIFPGYSSKYYMSPLFTTYYCNLCMLGHLRNVGTIEAYGFYGSSLVTLTFGG